MTTEANLGSVLTQEPAAVTPPVQASGTPAATGAGATSTSWLDSLGDDSLKNEPSLKLFKDPAALAKGWLNAQKMIGAEKIPVPGKHATDEDWQNVFKRLGLPETADKYEINLPKDSKFDPAFLTSYKDVALKAGILPKQAQALMEWYQGEAGKAQAGQAGQVEAQAQAQKVESDKALASLKEEWGKNWDQNVSRAQGAVREFGSPELSALLNQTGMGNHPAFIKLFSKMGGVLQEDTLKGNGNTSFGVSPEDAGARINEIMGDPNHPYRQAQHPNHRNAVDEVNKLFRIKTGQSA